MICVPCVLDNALEHSQAIKAILDSVLAQERRGGVAQGEREDLDAEIFDLQGTYPHTCGDSA